MKIHWHCASGLTLSHPIHFSRPDMDFLDIISAQNDCLVIRYLMVTDIFGFVPNLCLRQLFKEGNRQSLLDNFSSIFPSNSYNLGLEWTFLTFSMLNIIVLSLAI